MPDSDGRGTLRFASCGDDPDGVRVAESWHPDELEC